MNKTIEHLTAKIKEYEIEGQKAIEVGDIEKRIIALRFECELMRIRNILTDELIESKQFNTLSYEYSKN